jgi:hypothetical protein
VEGLRLGAMVCVETILSEGTLVGAPDVEGGWLADGNA